MLRVFVLGEFALEADGHPVDRIASNRARSLLAWLAVHPGLHPRARVASAFWPEVLDESARSSLRTTLATLKRELGEPAADVVTATRERVGIEPGGEVQIDLDSFEQLVSRGELQQAAALCRGDLLADLDDDWVNEPREHHRRQLLELLGRIAGEAEGAGDLDTALDRTREQVALDPLSEEAERELIRRLAAGGDRAGALAAYEVYAVRLQRELGLVPSAGIRGLVERIRSGEDGEGPRSPTLDAAGSQVTLASLPVMLLRDEPVPLVGRAAQLEQLRSVFARVEDGDLRAALITGEAGSGKTRLAAEFAREAHTSGASVWAGRCYEDSTTPYGAFLEALRGRVAVGRLPAWATAELSRLLPELGGFEAAPRAPAGDPEDARYRLFEAVVSAVVDASHEAPIVLVLEDLHWADHSTLLMLAHLTRTAPSSRILVLATAREGEPAVNGLATLLGELAHDRRLVRLPLEGLAEAEAAELTSAWLGEEAPIEVAAEIHERTGGNPLFIEELLRQAQDADRFEGVGLARAVPAGVREVIGQRLARLGEPSAEALAFAAALGHEFDIRELAEAVGRPMEEVIEAVDAALVARLLREVPGDATRVRFSHDLVRETVYEAQSAARRSLLHLRIADALEHLRGDDPDRLPELARHLADAGPAADVERVCRFAIRAAEQALAQLAYEDAAASCKRALRVADEAGSAGPWRADLLLVWGEACLRAGDRDGANSRFLEAAEAAREMRDAERLARAALGFAGLGVTIAAPRPEVEALLEEALAAVPAGSASRAPLLARLAIELYHARPAGRSARLSEEAVSSARAVGGSALLDALNARHVALWRPDHLEERLELADELVKRARGAGDREKELQGLNWSVLDQVEAGQLDGARDAIDAHEALATELRLPGYEWYGHMWRAMLAALAGDFEEAERLTAEGKRMGRRAQDGNAVLLFEVQRLYWGLLTGTPSDEDIDAIERRAGTSPAAYAWQAGLAEAQAVRSREEDARRWLHVAARDLDGLPRDANWLYTLTALGRVSAAIGELALAEPIYDLTLPYGARNVVAGRATVCLGSASLVLGEMAAALARPDEAERHFEEALRRNAELGAWPWLERTQLAFAETLELRGEASRARALRHSSHAGLTRASR